MKLRTLCLLLLAVGAPGCKKSPPEATEQAMASPAGPWVVSVADGSANLWKFEKPASGAVTWLYDPVTPAESSTGTYSGGEPGQGTLTDTQAAELWARVAAIEADTSTHIDARAKGTWLVSVEGASPSQRMTSGGPAIDALTAFLATVHTP